MGTAETKDGGVIMALPKKTTVVYEYRNSANSTHRSTHHSVQPDQEYRIYWPA